MQDYNLLYLLAVAVDFAFAFDSHTESSIKTDSKQKHKKILFLEGL